MTPGFIHASPLKLILRLEDGQEYANTSLQQDHVRLSRHHT